MDAFDIGGAMVLLTKSAAAEKPQTSYGMKGKLYLSKSGWLLLTVPNALGRGAFAALNEPGAELPDDASESGYNAHISVIRPEELEAAGLKPEDISERGKEFSYTLGPVRTVTPAGWGGVAKVWFIEATSPELKQLRKSYGLTPLPKDNEFQFHITFAIRKRGVLGRNETRKAASINDLAKRASRLELVASVGSREKVATYDMLSQLQAAKAESDRKNYKMKHMLLRQAMRRSPDDFLVEDGTGHVRGVTHVPTGFRFHLPADVITKQATDSIYGVAAQHHAKNMLAGRTPVYDPSRGILGSLSGHLQAIKERGDQTISQDANYQRLLNARDPTRSLRRFQQLLAGQRQPYVNHPVDKILANA